MFAEDPGASHKSLSTRSKRSVELDDATKRFAHAALLKVQGSLFETVEEPAAAIWPKAVQSLPSGLMKFVLNAVQDTLPHNVNLA